jgi:hypothetical protein
VAVSTGGLVTLDTNQTISGFKTFTSSITITAEGEDVIKVGRLRLGDWKIQRFQDNDVLFLYGGTNNTTGSGIEMYGINNSGNQGRFRIIIPSGENSKGFDVFRTGNNATLLSISTNGIVGLNNTIRGYGVYVGSDTLSTNVILTSAQPDTNYAFFITQSWGLNTDGQPESF